VTAARDVPSVCPERTDWHELICLAPGQGTLAGECLEYVGELIGALADAAAGRRDAAVRAAAVVAAG
jgi:hypothetical protein